MIIDPSQPSAFFPPAEEADEEGILGYGGELSPEWLLDAYAHGIFPWPVDDLLLWFSPDPRGILEFERFTISGRVLQKCRSPRFEVTCDRDFAGVLKGCATAQDRRRGTWLNRPMRTVYQRMHELGHAHSVEVWEKGELVGGTYGMALNGLFAAESMFYRVSDASKIALAYLVRHLQARGYTLLDLQQLSPTTVKLGGSEIPRAEYLERLSRALALPVSFGSELDKTWLKSTFFQSRER